LATGLSAGWVVDNGGRVLCGEDKPAIYEKLGFIKPLPLKREGF
jgi:hypothetical protein